MQHKAAVAAATNLHKPTVTRWGSHVEMLFSVNKNRQVIEATLLQLRRDNFVFQGNELMFVWELEWWESVSKICDILLPLVVLLNRVEKINCSLGRQSSSNYLCLQLWRKPSWPSRQDLVRS